MVSMDQKAKANYRCPDLKLYVRDVRDLEGKKRPVIVKSWATVKDLKENIQQLIHVQPSAQRLYFGPLLTSGKELPNHRTLHDAGIHRSGETLLLDIKGNSPGDSSNLSFKNGNDLRISSSMIDATPKSLITLVQQARRGFAVGLKPDLSLEGSGGTYFLHDSRKNKIAVFKPADEEPYAENNPRGYLRQQPGDSLRKGIAPGEACIREVAAYLLDHGGFSSVPMTTLVEAGHPAFNTNGARLNVSQGGASVGSHSFMSPVSSSAVSPPTPDKKSMEKPGSFQEFIRCECTMDDISPSKIAVEEVHKIAIMDIRIMNADRNAANLIVRRSADNSLELVPIDHGYCLRSVCDVSWMDWCWLDWPQLKEPVSEFHRKYIESLDIEADAQMLRDRLNICEEAVDYFRASSALLKAGVAAGLTLYDIAIMCCRNDDEALVPSMMEKLFSIASELAHIAVKNERWHHTAASQAIVEQLSSSRSSRRGSMVASSEYFRIERSFTSVDFLTLSSHNSYQSPDQVDDSPGLVQSCASDTSSEIDEEDNGEEREDCDRWAEKVIADVSMDQITPLGRPDRAESFSSDEASSDSGGRKGFWYVPPGHADTLAAQDDSSVAWSTDQSPHNSALRSSWSLDGNESESDNEAEEVEVKETAVKTPKVSFAVAEEPRLKPPLTVSVSEFKTVPNKLETGGMVRSKSYSGLSEHHRPTKAESLEHSLFDQRNNEDAYKKYFHKFIDLVIVRETSVALHQSRHGGRRGF